VSERLLVGDPAADAGPGRDVVDAYARLVDDLLERVPADAGLDAKPLGGRDAAGRFLAGAPPEPSDGGSSPQNQGAGA